MFSTFLGDRADVEVEPSLFVRSSDDDSDTDLSSSFQHVHVDPHATPDKLSNASVALQNSVTNTRTLMCTPCEGLVLPGRYCRAIIGIRDISDESLGLNKLKENTGNVHVDLKELQDRILQAIATLRFSVFEKPAGLLLSNITVRFPPVDPHHRIVTFFPWMLYCLSLPLNHRRGI